MKYILSLISFLSLVCLVSCRQNLTQSPESVLPGNWQLTMQGGDTNRNQTLEYYELSDITDVLYATVSFNKDGSGTFYSQQDTTVKSGSFRWAISADKKYVYKMTGADTVKLKLQVIEKDLFIQLNPGTFGNYGYWEQYERR